MEEPNGFVSATGLVRIKLVIREGVVGTPSLILEGSAVSSDSGIAVQGLEKQYGRLTALNGVSFSVPRGSIYGFLGPNGAGKTTTLRILATLLQPPQVRRGLPGRM